MGEITWNVLIYFVVGVIMARDYASPGVTAFVACALFWPFVLVWVVVDELITRASGDPTIQCLHHPEREAYTSTDDGVWLCPECWQSIRADREQTP